MFIHVANVWTSWQLPPSIQSTGGGWCAALGFISCFSTSSGTMLWRIKDIQT